MPRTRTALALTVLISALVLLAAPATALAGEYRAGDSVTVASGDTVADDLYVAAGTTVIEGTVDGDLTVAAGTVNVRGEVTGSVNVAGGDLNLSGTVGHAVRSMGGNLTVTGDVAGDVVATGGNVVIGEEATIGGDVAGGIGTLRVEGTVEGDILAGAGEVIIEGSVQGRIDANVGHLRIGPDASISGDVRYASEREAEIADGAEIGGETQRTEPEWAGYQALLPDNPVVTFIGALLGLLVLGWGLMLLRPGWVVHPGVALQARPLLSLGAGLAAWVGQFLVLIGLGILGALLATLATSWGGAFVIPFLVVLFAVIALIFVSQVFVAMAIGSAITGLGMTASPWVAYALGALIWAAVLSLLGWLVAALGAVAFFLGWILGLGAFALDTIERRRRDTLVGPAAPAAI